MRHRIEGRKLSRTASHRKALLSSLSTALIKHKKIKTTLAKAREARRIVEPLITRARNAHRREKAGNPVSVAARRQIAKFIHDREAVTILFGEIAEKIGDRQGGYTRVVKLGRRLGDAAEMAVLELVDYNLAQDAAKKKVRGTKAKAGVKKEVKGEAESVETGRKRTRRSKAKKAAAGEEAAPGESAVTEETAAEIPVTEATASPAGETAADAPTGESGGEEPKA